MIKLVRQGPTLQRPGLIQGIDLLLKQSQIMQGIADKATVRVRPLVPRNLLTAAAYDDLIDEAIYDNIPVTIGGWYRIVARPITDQRC